MFFVSMTFLRASGPPRFTSGPHFLLKGLEALRFLYGGPEVLYGGPEVLYLRASTVYSILHAILKLFNQKKEQYKLLQSCNQCGKNFGEEIEANNSFGIEATF